MQSIILSSASPRRADILKQLHIPFLIRPSDADESLPPLIPPEKAVVMLAERKATSCNDREAGIILAADTLVESEGKLLGKPEDDRDAFRMLSALSGKTHRVYTGVAIRKDGRLYSDYCVTEVCFRHLSREDICSYIRTGEPRGKAGGYGIQGIGAMLVSQIRGDYYNVVGLPVSTLTDLFQTAGISISKLMGDDSVASKDFS